MWAGRTRSNRLPVAHKAKEANLLIGLAIRWPMLIVSVPHVALFTDPSINLEWRESLHRCGRPIAVRISVSRMNLFPVHVEWNDDRLHFAVRTDLAGSVDPKLAGDLAASRKSCEKTSRVASQAHG